MEDVKAFTLDEDAACEHGLTVQEAAMKWFASHSPVDRDTRLQALYDVCREQARLDDVAWGTED